MTDARRPLAAAQLLDLRTPLSRVALAASRLGREAVTPAQHELAAILAEAVRDLDGRIEGILALLVDVGPRAGPREELRAVRDAMRSRLGAALAARGIEWLDPPGDEPAVRGPAGLVRSLLVELLRLGSTWAGPGGSLRLAVAGREGGGGLVLSCRPGACGPGGDPDAAFGLLATRVAGAGARIERLGGADVFAAALWLPGVS